MIAMIDQYRKELSSVAEFAPSTVDNYVSSIGAFWVLPQRPYRPIRSPAREPTCSHG